MGNSDPIFICCLSSGVTKGEICPRRSVLGRQIEVGILWNNYKMSNASDCYLVAKSHQDHQDSQSELLRTLRFMVELLSPAINVACGLPCGCVTMLSDGQPEQRTSRLRSYIQTTVASQSDRNPAFIVHALCYCAMGVGRIFSRWGTRGFFQNFSSRAKSGEISFFPLKAKTATLVCWNCQNPGVKAPAPLPTSMYCVCF